MNRAVIVAILCAGLCSCVTVPTASEQRVKVADASMVTGCKFLGTVTDQGFFVQNAENEARGKAAALGANRIVWLTIQDGEVPNASGEAYLCKE
ncbi:MAG: hypothetical protein KGL63_02860 [Betaproteobacteria bacterium]|nr:hypothetical protein [Betaproteobacteria bacterium]